MTIGVLALVRVTPERLAALTAADTPSARGSTRSTGQTPCARQPIPSGPC